MKNYRADKNRHLGVAEVEKLKSIAGEATITHSRAWGPGPRTIAKIVVGEWSYELLISGLAADCGLSGPYTHGWEGVAIREEVEEYLHARLRTALEKMPPLEKPALAMSRGDSRDRSMGWDSWPSGPESVDNRVTIPA